MTDDRMALVELPQKSGDCDFLRAVAEAVLQILLEADIDGLIGAGRQNAVVGTALIRARRHLDKSKVSRRPGSRHRRLARR